MLPQRTTEVLGNETLAITPSVFDVPADYAGAPGESSTSPVSK